MKLNRNLPWKGVVVGGLLGYYLSVLSCSFYQFSPRLGKLFGAPFRGLAYFLQFIASGSAGSDLAYNYAVLFLIVLGVVLGYLFDQKLNKKPPINFLRWYYPVGLAVLILILFLSQSSYLGKQRSQLTGVTRIQLNSLFSWSLELGQEDELYQEVRSILLATIKSNNTVEVENPESLLKNKTRYGIYLDWDKTLMAGRRSLHGNFIPKENILFLDRDKQCNSMLFKEFFEELEQEIYSFEHLNEVRLFGREKTVSLAEDRLNGLKQNLTLLDSAIILERTERGRIVGRLMEEDCFDLSEQPGFYRLFGEIKLTGAARSISLYGCYHQPTGVLVFGKDHVYQVRESLI